MLEAVRESSASRSVSHPLFTIRGSRKTLDHRTASGHSSPHDLASLSSRMRPSDNLIYGECRSVDRVLLDSAQASNSTEQKPIINGSSDLAQIWRKCIDNCHSKTLQQLLSDHGKLASIKEFEGMFSFLHLHHYAFLGLHHPCSFQGWSKSGLLQWSCNLSDSTHF